MIGKLAPKALSGLLALALGITMCPAAGLAYAAEGEGQQSTSNSTPSTSGTADRVNQDVQLETSGSSAEDGSADDASGNGQGSAGSSEGMQQDEAISSGADGEESAGTSGSSNKYISSVSGQTSADVPLAGDATVGTIEYNGLAYTINEDDDSTVSVTGLASSKPTGDVQIPAQITSKDKLYKVTGIKAIGLPNDASQYAEIFFDEQAKALAVRTISLPATVTSIEPALFQLFPNATDINVSTDNETYTSYDGAIYSTDLTKLILVPQGRGSLVLPDNLTTVPAYALSQCNKLSVISFPGSTGNDFFAVRNNVLYTNDLSTLLAAPAGLGASASIAAECTTIAEGAFFGNTALDTIVVNGVVEGIASAGDSATGADGQPLMGGSAVDGSTLPAFDSATVENATVVINVTSEADGDEAAAMIERAKAAWVAYGFTKFKEPAAPGTEIVPEEGSGFAFTLLSDYTLSVRWAGATEPPAAIDIPDYGIIDGVQYTVSTIADNGFSNYTSLVTADIPQTVASIGDSAFELCTSLQTVHFDSVASIGSKAFANTALLSLVLPTTVQSIGDNAFSNMKETTIVAMGSIADNSPIALGAAAGLSIYVPYGTEGTWDAGIPTLGNHIYPYGVNLSDEPLELEVGQTANINDNGYIEAPGAIEASYAYKANPVSINTDDGTIEAKAAGSTYINVSLQLTIDQVAVKGNVNNVVKLQPVSTNSEEESNIVSVPQTISLAADTMNAVMLAAADEPSAQADSDADMFTFTVLNESSRTASIQVKSGMEAQLTGSLIIPSTCTLNDKTYTVTSIATYGFRYCSKITSVMIPGTIESIGNWAFGYCSALEDVSIADGNRPLTLGGWIFGVGVSYSKDEDGNVTFKNQGKLKELFIPSRATSINGSIAVHASGLETFSVASENPNYTTIDGILYTKDQKGIVSIPPAYGGGSVDSFVVPSTVQTIANSTFDTNMYFKKVTIPDSVTSIGQIAFCNSFIEEIWVYGTPSLNALLWDIYHTKVSQITVHCPASEVTKWEAHKNEAVSSPLGDKLTVEVLPSYDSLLEFTAIAGTMNASVKIKEGCESQLEGALLIPSTCTINGQTYTVTQIPTYGFRNCTKITSVMIPDTIEKIDTWVFYNCRAIENISIADGDRPLSIGGWLLYSPYSWSRDADGNVVFTNIGKFKELFIPSRVTSISGSIAVHASGWEKFTVASENPNYTTIDGILYTKDQKGIVSIPPAYGGGAIDSFVVPSTVQTIANSTFDTNMHIKKVTIPSSVTSIGQIAFCNSFIEDIWVYGTPSLNAMLWDIYHTKVNKITVHCPASEVEEWEKHKNEPGTDSRPLGDKLVIVPLPSYDSLLEFTAISGTSNASVKVKSGCQSQIEGALIIPSTCTIGGKTYTVTQIESYGFQKCVNITSVMVPETIESIGTAAFLLCRAIETVAIADGDRPLTLGGYLFECDASYSKDADGNVTFTNQGSLKELFIPSRVTSISGSVAVHASALERFTVASENPNYTTIDGILYTKDQKGIVSIPPAYGAGSIDSFVVPSTVQTIANSTFDTNMYIKKVTIPDSVTSIGNIAFCNSFIEDIWVYGSPSLATNLWSQYHKKVDKITVHCTAGEVANWETHRNEPGAGTSPLGNKLVIESISNTYNVIFHANDGNGTTNATNVPGTQFILTGNCPAPPTGTPSRAGYTFGGWFREAACTTQYNFDNMPISTNLNLFAKWTPIVYTITYNRNGGADVTANPTTYTIEQTVKLNDLAKTGYRFDGWVETTEGVASADPVIGLTIPRVSMGDRSFEARFTPIAYTLRFSTAVAGETTVHPDDRGPVTVEDADPVLPGKAEAERTGYTLDSWAVGSDAYAPGSSIDLLALLSANKGSSSVSESGGTGVVTFQAQWTENTYTIRFENGHDHATSEPKADVTGIRYSSASAALGEIPYTNYGYAASGWGVTDGTSGAFKADGETAYTGKQLIEAGADEGDDHSSSEKTITLYANWAPRTYTIRYASYKMSGTDKVDADGVKLVGDIPGVDVPSASEQTLTIEDARSADGAPAIEGDITSAYTGYAFSQWKGGSSVHAYSGPSAEGGASSIDESAFRRLFGEASGDTASETASLTAVWKVKTYTIFFDKADGGFSDGITESQHLSRAYNDTMVLPTASQIHYEKQGYVLTKWMTSAEGSTVAGEVATLRAAGGSDSKTTAERTVNVWEIIAKDGIAVEGAEDAPEITLYAKWEGDNGIGFTVRYHYERAGSPSSGGGAFAAGDTLSGTAKAGETIELADRPGGVDFLEATRTYTMDGVSRSYALIDASYDNGVSSVTSAKSISMSGDAADNVVDVYYRLELSVTYRAGQGGQGADQLSSSKAGWGDLLPATPDVAESGTSETGIAPADQYASELSHWTEARDPAAELSTAELATAKIYDDAVYTASWKPIEYRIAYAYAQGEEHEDGVELPDETEIPFTYQDILDGRNAGTYTLSASGEVSQGFSFAGWLNTGNPGDASAYPAGETLTSGDEGTFLKLFPDAPSVREAALYMDILENEYEISFYRFSSADERDMFDVSGLAQDAPIKAASQVMMPTQMKDEDDTSGSKLTGLAGSGSIADTKIAGYALSKWSASDAYAEASALIPASRYAVSVILDRAYGDGNDADITIADGKAKGTIELYAAWTAVYSASLPTDSATAKIVIRSVDKTGASEADVKVENRGPHAVWVTATSEVVKDDFGNVSLWEAIVREDGTHMPYNSMPEAGFTFSWSGDTFPLNGGAISPFELTARSSISDKLAFSIPATGYKVNPSLDDGYETGPDGLYVDRGQIARIIWTISATKADGSAYQDTSAKVYPAMP